MSTLGIITHDALDNVTTRAATRRLSSKSQVSWFAQRSQFKYLDTISVQNPSPRHRTCAAETN
jgi:hypothetical protein